MSAAVHHGTSIQSLSDEFVQYSADNVGHNIRTLDGNNTFHGMGIIAMVTPATSVSHTIPKVKVDSKEIARTGHINIKYYREENHALATLCYNSMPTIVAYEPTASLDILWQTSLLFSSSSPSWSGMMQFIHDEPNPGKSSVLFLPMIDMSSSDPTCIYSTLSYVAEHAKQHGITPIITFDQPLYWKALSIILAQPVGNPVCEIILRLGGLHTQMSFLGSIGHLMAGSGLSELLRLIYAPQAVDHMLSGKAISRAIRGHLLLYAALSSVLLAKTLTTPDITDPNTEGTDGELHPDVQETKLLYDDLMTKEKSTADVCSRDVLTRIQLLICEQMKSMDNNRTAKLWLLYMDMIRTLMKFIKAERMGN